MKASDLEDRLSRLGPVWALCDRWDQYANRRTFRPLMAGDTVRYGERSWRVHTIDSTNGQALLEAGDRRKWAPISALKAVR